MSPRPGDHSSSYVFTQWGNGQEAKVFTYNVTDDHVDNLKFGPAKNSPLSFDFTKLFGQTQASPQSQRQTKPPTVQPNIIPFTSPPIVPPTPTPTTPQKRPTNGPPTRPPARATIRTLNTSPTRRPFTSPSSRPHSPKPLPRKPKSQTDRVKPPRPPGPPPRSPNVPVPSPVIKGLGNPPLRFGFGPFPLSVGPSKRPAQFGFGPTLAPQHFGPSQAPLQSGPPQAPLQFGPSSQAPPPDQSPASVPVGHSIPFSFEPLRFGPSTSQTFEPVRFGPSTQQNFEALRFGPSTPKFQNFGPSTPQSFEPAGFGPSTKQTFEALRFGPSTPELPNFGPSTPQSFELAGFGPSTKPTFEALRFGPLTPELQNFGPSTPQNFEPQPFGPSKPQSFESQFFGSPTPQAPGALRFGPTQPPIVLQSISQSFGPSTPVSLRQTTAQNMFSSTPRPFVSLKPNPSPSSFAQSPSPLSSSMSLGHSEPTRTPFFLVEPAATSVPLQVISSTPSNPSISQNFQPQSLLPSTPQSVQPLIFGQSASFEPLQFGPTTPQSFEPLRFGPSTPQSFESIGLRANEPHVFGPSPRPITLGPDQLSGITSLQRGEKSESFGSQPNVNSHFAFLRQQIKEVKNTLPNNFGILHPQIGLSPTFFGSENTPTFVFGKPPDMEPLPTDKPTKLAPQPSQPPSPLHKQTFMESDKIITSTEEEEKENLTILNKFKKPSKRPDDLNIKPVARKKTLLQDIRILITDVQDLRAKDIEIPVMIVEEQTTEIPDQSERLSIVEKVANLHVFGPLASSNQKVTEVQKERLPEVLHLNKHDKAKTKERGTTTTASPVMTAIRGKMEFKSSSDSLQERIRKLKETVRKTKESLTSKTLKKAQKKRRKRVRGRKRLLAPKTGEGTELPKRLTIIYPENVNLPTFVRQQPKKSDMTNSKTAPVLKERTRSRGRGRSRRPPLSTTLAPSSSDLEKELEDKYGKTVVSSLFNVLVKAVRHPDKNRILHQLKGQLASMNIEDVKRLQFGVENKEITAGIENKFVSSINTKDEEDTSLLGNVLETQLKRVESLAQRFAKKRKQLKEQNNDDKSEKDTNQSVKRRKSQIKILNSNSAAEDPRSKGFHGKKPENIQNSETTTRFSPTIRPRDEDYQSTVLPTEKPNLPVSQFTPMLVQVESVNSKSDTKSSMFSIDSVRERLSMIKKKIHIMEDKDIANQSENAKNQLELMMDGTPDGSPGLQKGFFERIPLLPVTPQPKKISKERIASIKQGDLPNQKSKVQSSILTIRERLRELSNRNSLRLNKLNQQTIMEDEDTVPRAPAINNIVPVSQSPEQANKPDHSSSPNQTVLLGMIPHPRNVEQMIKDSHEAAGMGLKIPTAHRTEMKIQAGHGLPGEESTLPIAVMTETNIKKIHEKHSVQNHPVNSNKMIPEAQEAEREIVGIHEANEDEKQIDNINMGVPTGSPGLSSDFKEEIVKKIDIKSMIEQKLKFSLSLEKAKKKKKIEASFLEALEKGGTGSDMEDPGGKIEAAVHRIYDNQQFVGSDDGEMQTMEPTKLHLFNSSDLVLMDFMVHKLKTQPGMKTIDMEKARALTQGDTASILMSKENLFRLSHDQLEKLKNGYNISESEEEGGIETKRLMQGEQTTILMTPENMFQLTHPQLDNLKTGQERDNINIQDQSYDDIEVVTQDIHQGMLEMSPSKISIPKVVDMGNVFSKVVNKENSIPIAVTKDISIPNVDIDNRELPKVIVDNVTISKSLVQETSIPNVVSEVNIMLNKTAEGNNISHTVEGGINIPKFGTEEGNLFSPTSIPSMLGTQSKRRRFKSRLQPTENKPRRKDSKDIHSVSEEKKKSIRRLFRNRHSTEKPKPTKEDQDKKSSTSEKEPNKETTEKPKITIEEKSNPRKIVFRKSFNGRRLANGRLMLRKKKGKAGEKDPLVESLLSQIKRQKFKHSSFRRDRKGEVVRRLPGLFKQTKVGYFI